MRRFVLWLLPARRVRIPAREGPRQLGGWADLPYEDDPRA